MTIVVIEVVFVQTIIWPDLLRFRFYSSRNDLNQRYALQKKQKFVHKNVGRSRTCIYIYTYNEVAGGSYRGYDLLFLIVRRVRRSRQ